VTQGQTLEATPYRRLLTHPTTGTGHDANADVPGHGTTVRGLQQTVAGLAFAGTRGIKHVEISTYSGESWTLAVIHAPLSPYSWIFWHYD